MANKPKPKNHKPTLRFEAVKIDPLFEVLDAIAWLDGPATKDISQYADIDGEKRASRWFGAIP
jgi:hypothetical protein